LYLYHPLPPLYPLCPYSNHHLLILSPLSFLPVSFKLQCSQLTSELGKSHLKYFCYLMISSNLSGSMQN
jgi:hypothetical protein